MRKCSVIYRLVFFISVISADLCAASLADMRRASLDEYLNLLIKGASHDALRVDALADLPFNELKRVIVAYSKLKNPTNDHAFQQLILRNSRQYLLPRELLELYAKDYLSWLAKEKNLREQFLKVLEQSRMDRGAADLAIRLSPDESIEFIKKNIDAPFSLAMLEAWNRRLKTRHESRSINQAMLMSLLSKDHQGKAFLIFKGYWQVARTSLAQALSRLFESGSRDDVMKALAVQSVHPYLCDRNTSLITKWIKDREIVIQLLRNMGRDVKNDHSLALNRIWDKISNNIKFRYWCLYSMAVHPKGNENIALEALREDGYESLDLTLEILQQNPELLKMGIAAMLKLHQRGRAELFLYADKYKIKGFEVDALRILKESEEQVTLMNALAYLGHSKPDLRMKLLKFLSHPIAEIRLAAINAFEDTRGFTKTHLDEIGPTLIRVFQSDASYGNRQQALFVLGKWKSKETSTVFRELLKSIDKKDYAGDEYWENRMRLMCWLALARKGDAEAHSKLKWIHDTGTNQSRMDILLAYLDMKQCVDFAFSNLNLSQPKLAATATSLIRRYGSAQQQSRLQAQLNNPLWREFQHVGLDDYGILEHGGGAHAHCNH